MPLLALVMGVLALMEAALVKTGRLRWWARWYRNPDAPIWLRHAAFAFGPVGLGFLFGALGGWELERSTGSSFGVMAVVVALLFLATAGLILLRPPRWVKPTWVL